ncbi:kelch repeat-containing protein [Phytohabitans houttuyneae]|uniref:Kelch repeat-containing protein n=1 Tax=Phytohabitans houttuyneae TaxID=1076126 RepID=UPI0031EAF3D4
MRLRYPSLLLTTLLAAAACTDSPDEPRTTESAPGSPAPSVTAALTWQRLAAAPSARTEVAAATTGSQVYVVGGYRADGGTVATVEVFDTATGKWTAGPDLPVAVNHAMAATVDNEVYVFGGFLANGDPGKDAFKLEGGAWRPIAPLPQERAAGTAVAQSGKVYVAGGLNAGGLARQMLVYEPATNLWTNAPGPPTPREHLGGAGFGGKVYTVGGRAGGQGNFTAFESFDPTTNQWTVLPDLPTRRGGLAAAATCSGQVVAVGGEAEATFEEAEAFDVKAGTWSSLPPMLTPRHGLGVIAMGTTLYTFAGGPKPGLHVADSAESMDLAPLGSC